MQFPRPLVLAFAATLLACSEAAAQTAPPNASALITRYCTGCHNEKTKTAGLAINVADLKRIPETAELWEKVVSKLETRAMPPATAPRPKEAEYNAILNSLVTELDRDALARPRIGKLPLLHRLTRTEYQNSIRDLLGLDALPKEYEISYLCPRIT